MSGNVLEIAVRALSDYSSHIMRLMLNMVSKIDLNSWESQT